MNVKRNVFFENIGLIFYKIILDLVYVFFICDEYGYNLNFKVDFDFVRFVEGWVLCGIIIALIPRKQSIVAYYLLMQFIITIMPMLVIYGLYDRSRFFIYLICIVHSVQCVLEKCINFKIPYKTMLRQGSDINRIIIVLVAGSVFFLTLVQFGLPGFQALNINNVYMIRAENSVSGVLAYLTFWFFNVVLPMVIVYSLIKGKKVNMFLFCAVALFLYMTYAQKSWLMSLFFILAIYVACKRDIYTKCCCIGLPLLVTLCMICYRLNRKLIVLPSMFVRRVLFVPADIKFEYYEFFENREKLHFSEGMIGKIFKMEPVYDKEIALIIGDELGEVGSSCNTGYLADAYANLGTLGVILFGLLLFLILKVLDIALKKEDFVANFSVVSYSLYTLNDGALLTRLLTGGLALLIVMLILERNRSQEKREVSGTKDTP